MQINEFKSLADIRNGLENQVERLYRQLDDANRHLKDTSFKLETQLQKSKEIIDKNQAQEANILR